MPVTIGRVHKTPRHAVGQRAETPRRPGTVGLLLACALGLLVVPLAAAQQAGKGARIGLLVSQSPAVIAPNLAAFQQGLRDLGYVEGHHIALEYRFAEGRADLLPALAAELVRLPVDVIVAASTPATLAAKHATTTLPIVFVALGNPVGTGVVASLARPGGNLTGLTNMGTELNVKRLELLQELLPTLSRVALLWNPANTANVTLFEETQTAARALGVTLQSLPVQSAEECESAFATLHRERPDALILTADPLLQLHIGRIIDVAAQNGLPTISQQKLNAVAGILLAYGPNDGDMYRRAASYVHKILTGAKPADLPVERPMRFELVLNLKTAQALGITIPPTLLFQADEVIH